MHSNGKLSGRNDQGAMEKRTNFADKIANPNLSDIYTPRDKAESRTANQGNSSQKNSLGRSDLPALASSSSFQISHNIPHLFTKISAFFLSPNSKCMYCRKKIKLLQHVVRCKECEFVCCESCSERVPPRCGLSIDLIANSMAFVEVSRNFKSPKSEHVLDEVSEEDIGCGSISMDLDKKAKRSSTGSLDHNMLESLMSVEPPPPLQIAVLNDLPLESSDRHVISNAEEMEKANNEQKNHKFEQFYFNSPRPCDACDDPIWNLEGFQCKCCQRSVHKGCSDCVPQCQDIHGEYQSKFPSNNTILSKISSPDVSSHVKHRRTPSKPGQETLLRLTRRTYRSLESMQQSFRENMAPVPEIVSDNSSGNERKFRRRVHYFRGHEFMATYLISEDQPSGFSCQICSQKLGDRGKQCYQCRLCDFYCHKLCFTKSKPCEISVKPLLSTETENSDYHRDQLKIVRSRGSFFHSLSRKKNSSWLQDDKGNLFEDFSDEVVPLNIATKTRTLNRKSNITDKELFEDSDYVFEDGVLGSGQYGVVKKGHYRHKPSEEIAVKIIDKKRLWSPNRQLKHHSQKKQDDSSIPQNLRRELEILQRLDHPGIIRMHHYIDTPTHTYVIMDMAKHGDLLDYVMKKQKMDEPEVLMIAKQAVSALGYLHKHGICHRDMKPENLLLGLNEKTGQLNVRIADFGFATSFGLAQQTMMYSVVGTPAYMAPEVVDSRVWKFSDIKNPPSKGYDISADMWSLGVILYVCLSGVFPFDSQQPILDQIIGGEFYFPDEYFSDVSDEAIDFICHLLVVNPRRRMTCKQCYDHIWFKNE